MAHKDKSVLIVDDEHEVLEILEELIIKLSCKVFKATNSDEAIKLAIKLNPSVILLDLDLNEESGYDVLDRIRSEPNLSIVPVIVVSGYSEQQELLRSIEHGADDYIQKPFNSSVLRLKIKNQLKINRVGHSLQEHARALHISQSLPFGLIEFDQHYKILWSNTKASQILATPDMTSLKNDLKTIFRNRKAIIKENKQLSQLMSEFPDQKLVCWLPENQYIEQGLYLIECINQKWGFNNNSYLVQIKSLNREIKTTISTYLFEHYIAHKLNTPMHQILTPLQLLQSDNSLNSESKILVEMALNAAEELHYKHQGLLDYINTRKLSPACIDTLSFPTFVDIIKSFFTDSSLKLCLYTALSSSNLQIIVSKQILESIFQEIHLNAEKYCSVHPIIISIFIDLKNNSHIVVTIKDNGDLPKSFPFQNCLLPYEQFTKFGLSSDKGFGLGLSKLRFMLWNINGDLEVLHPNQGDGFTIQISLEVTNSKDYPFYAN